MADLRIRYRTGRKGSGKFTKRARRGVTLERMRKMASKLEGPYVVWTHRRKARSRFTSLDAAMASVARRARRERPDYELDRIFLRARGSDVTLVLQEAIPLAEAPSVGTCAVVKAHRQVYGLVPGAESWGIYNPRNIAGTSTPSDHCYANAEDYHGTPRQMRTIADWLVSNAKRLSVRYVIYDGRIWTKESGGWRSFSGNPHTDHVHASFDPKLTGPCRAVRCAS